MSIIDERDHHHRDVRSIARGVAASIFKSCSVYYWRHADLFSIVILLLFSAMMIALAHLRPIYNWDALAYLAASMRDSFDSIGQLHEYVYSTLRDAAPPSDFTDLTQADAYRVRQAADPQAFVSMLGMYEVKWLYIWSLKLLIPYFGPFGAAQTINLVALIVMVVAIGLWLRSTRLSGYAPLVLGLLFLLQFQGFSGTWQPDFLANALMIASLLSYERGRPVLGSVLMILTVLTRPDQVATTGVLMACAWFVRDRNTSLFALTFLLSVVAWLVISRMVHSVGWWPHFWFSTYQAQETMADFKPAFSIQVYLNAIAVNLFRSLFQNTWLSAYGMALAWAAYSYRNAAVIGRRRQMLLLAMLLTIPAKFLIFPLHDGRIYFAPLMAYFLIAFAAARSESRSDIAGARLQDTVERA